MFVYQSVYASSLMEGNLLEEISTTRWKGFPYASQKEEDEQVLLAHGAS